MLACKECNGDEKRDQSWKDFLKLNCGKKSTFALRLRQIESWRSKPATKKPVMISGEAKAAKSEVEDAIVFFEKKFVTLREKIR